MGGDAPCHCDGTDGLPGIGGGVFNIGAFSIANTIVAGQYAGVDCAGTPPAAPRYSIDGDGTCVGAAGTGNRPFSTARLGPLSDYGGPTPTRALVFGSAALDAGDPAGCIDADGRPLTVDQRGLPRRNRCDVGAFELQRRERPLREVAEPLLTALLPLKLWIGLYDARPIRVDVRAEVYLNDKLIGVGTRRNLAAGGPGTSGPPREQDFGLAREQTIPLRLVSGPKTLSPRDSLRVLLLAGVSCGYPEPSGYAVFWYDDAEAASGFGAIVDGRRRTYYLRGPYDLGLLPGSGGKTTVVGLASGEPCRQSYVGGWEYGPAAGDFNGDGMADILWRDPSGALQLWLVWGGGNTAIRDKVPVPSLGPDWTIAGIADFNGDDAPDLLWRHTSGAVVVWLMHGAEVLATGALGAPSADWKVERVGDFDGDRRADILWRHASGQLDIWSLNGTDLIGRESPGSAPSDRTAAAVADFDGDGKADILWRDTSGAAFIWLMDGAAIRSVAALGTVPSDWTLAGVYARNGRADIVWRHTSGPVSLWRMDGTTVVRTGSLGSMGADWSVVGVADYAAFEVANAVWRHDSGTVVMWYIHDDFTVHGGVMGSIGTEWAPQ
jgi:hypothetical protein